MLDRPMQSTPTDPRAEEEHNDLLATLAAARELGPEMDKALAESYLQCRKASAPSRARNADPRPPVNYGFVAQSVVPVVLIVAVILAAILFTSHGWIWFLLIPLFWGGWRRRRGWYGYDRYDRRREFRDERRAEREEWRRARRDDRYDWS